MYTITDTKDQIGLNAVINSNMIIGVIDRNSNRTCIMRTHFYDQMYKRFELSKYVVLPFISLKKICNENINSNEENNICNIESNDIKELLSTNNLGGKGLKPVKSFDNWKEAYEWMLGINEDKGNDENIE
jgi:hypothetical protein